MKPRRMVSDYETAMRKAAKEVWPGIVTAGCVFHHRQALRRNYLKRVRKPLTLIDARHHKIIKRMIQNIQFLPANMVVAGARVVRDAELNYGVLRNFRSFNKYFARYWLRTVKPEGFSMYRVDHRTDNINESMNAKMSRGMSRHPSYYRFLNFMNTVMITENQKIIANEVYKQASRMTANLMEAWDDLDRGRLGTEAFLRKDFNRRRRN